MKLLYVIFTYNRPKILNECLRTIFSKNSTLPDKLLFIDDGSEGTLKMSLLKAQIGSSIPTDIFSFNPNNGYGPSFEFAFRAVEVYNPEYVFFIESDYIFAQNGLDMVMDIFENTDVGRNAVGFSGYDNPDFHVEHKTTHEFPPLMIKDCGEDNLNRSIMYKPFKHTTKFGEIDLEFVSNSCGTMYLNWSKVVKFKELYPKEYELWINGVVLKNEANRLPINDGMLSHGIGWLWNKWAIQRGIDREKYAALLNIRPSIANHINGGGINGGIVPEGATFVTSPTWK